MSRLRSAAQNGGLALLALALVFGVLELGTRLFVSPEVWRFRDASADWQIDRRIGWVNKPQSDESLRIVEEVVRYRTNEDGIFPWDTRRERQPGVDRVMVFGDSMVVGRSLPQDLVYTARLEERLAARGLSVEVINAGVEGYSTDQALLLMERLLPIYQPDVAVYGSTLNDFGGNSSREAYLQPKPMFSFREGEGLRLAAPEPRERIHPRTMGWRSVPQHSAFYRWLQPRIFRLRARLGDWRQRMLLGEMQLVYVQPDLLDQLDWSLYAALLSRMQRAARAAHGEFLFFSHPEVGEVWEPYIANVVERFRVPRGAYDPRAVERRVRRAARRAGVPFVPTVQYFAARSQRGPFHLLPHDAHLSPAGHQVLAELLAEELQALLAQEGERRLRAAEAAANP